jgi:hypothetical protein
VRQTLYKRLQQLEEADARARKHSERPDEEASKARVLNKIILFLRLRGVEKQAHETLAEAWACALEIDCLELKRLLGARIDPIHKYSTDHGVFEEIERRKAAGTWPGGYNEWQ